ncbi:fatty acid desaturase [Luteolibacter sp. Populi]|uniref:fatty acid desaturase family protein n=1 Tax=Luteolibacter sp. Populi TaxID=3230487 RepID=UPI003465F376
MDSAEIPKLPAGLAQEFHTRGEWRHGVRLLCFIALYLAGAAAAIHASASITAWWQWFLLAPVYLLAAASLHGISLFTHEAVHGTLSRNRFWNDLLGAACAIPVLQNCSAYRVLHLRHHSHLGEDGDPDHYANYTRWSWMVFTMNWARLLVGYPVYIVAIPILGFKHGTAKARAGILAEVAATALVIGAIAASPLPAAWFVHGWLIPMLFINTMVNIRGMSQHTLLEHADDEIRGTRSILTVPLVRFFMCNENYHLEHHLYPGVPWHQLPKVHEALEGELREKGAPYIPSYSSFVRDFVLGSLKRSPLGWRQR